MTRASHRQDKYPADVVAFIELNYGRKGPTWIAQQLGRDRKRIIQWAHNRGLRFGMTQGTMTIPEVAIEAGCTEVNVYRHAKRDGALKRAGPLRADGKRSRCIVPNKWARSFIAQHRELVRNGELKEAGWLTVYEVAKALGVTRWAVDDWTAGAFGAGSWMGGDFAATVKVVRARIPGRMGAPANLYEPLSVEALRVKVAAAKAKARRMNSVKGLAVELGLSSQTVITAAKAMDPALVTMLPVGPYLLAHLAPHVAQALRERYGHRRAP